MAIVCICGNISEETIRKTIRKHNITTIKELQRHLPVAFGCKTCESCLYRLICEDGVMDKYKKDHTWAKFIVCHVVILLLTAAQMATLPWSLMLNAAAVYVWFFGVNPIAYILEWVLNHEHKHDKL